VIHCSATPLSQVVTIEDITDWHLKRGFKSIGYHYVIYPDGSVHNGRNVQKVGAHAQGYNSDSIGICYIGGTKYGLASDTRTPEQKLALRNLVEVLKNIYDIEDVCGHRDLSVDLNSDGVIQPGEWMKYCPSFDVKTQL
jgi:N-acetyl-anhydromuramyl-L-alanine amidase AmpD